MGIIAKQSIKGSIYTYAGALLGFISTGLLLPNFFAKEQVGLINLLIALSITFSQISGMGFVAVITRLFPYFRNDKKKHNGILTLGMIVVFVGFTIVLIGFFFLKDFLIESNVEKSALLHDNIFYLPIIVLFSAFFGLLDNYNKSLFDATTGIFLREFYVRILNLVIIVAYIFDYINFSQFVFTYVLIYISPTVIITFVLIKRNVFYLAKINFTLVKKLKKEIISVSVFWIIAGFTWIATQAIDKYMVNYYLGLDATGIYSVTFYFGVLVAMPARTSRKISSIIIAESWKKNDQTTIMSIYKKSTVNMLIISLLLLIGIWANIDNIFKLIPKYSDGKYVILFIALSSVIEMSAGVGATIISNSKYFKFNTYAMVLVIIAIIFTNQIFIPKYHLSGAAFASMISLGFAVLLRYLFLLKTYKFQPYNYRHLVIIIIAGLTYFVSTFIPEFSNFYIDIIVRSMFILTFFTLLIYFSKVSQEVSDITHRIIKNVKNIIR